VVLEVRLPVRRLFRCQIVRSTSVEGVRCKGGQCLSSDLELGTFVDILERGSETGKGAGGHA
jgi:hypothetical protein